MKNECPICQLHNRCGKDEPQCWCMQIRIPEQVKTQINALNTPESCICVNCLQKLTGEDLSTQSASYSQTVDK